MGSLENKSIWELIVITGLEDSQYHWLFKSLRK